MRVLLDVDGVAADFTKSLLYAVGSTVSPREILQWDFIKQLPPDEKEQAEEILRGEDFWLNLPMMEGAEQGVQRIRDLGHKITWVTSPWDSCPMWNECRRAWIQNHFGDQDPIIIAKDKEHEEGDIFIDDKVENVEKWQRANPSKKAFLFDAPYNKKSALPRVTWKSLLEKL